jgi:hypothetical protein
VLATLEIDLDDLCSRPGRVDSSLDPIKNTQYKKGLVEWHKW